MAQYIGLKTSPFVGGDRRPWFVDDGSNVSAGIDQDETTTRLAFDLGPGRLETLAAGEVGDKLAVVPTDKAHAQRLSAQQPRGARHVHTFAASGDQALRS